MTITGEQDSILGVTIPQDWVVTTVGQQYDIQLGKMLDAEKNHGDWKPYLGNRAVQWGQINIDVLPTMQMTRGDQQRYRLAKGDILVCEGGEVGRAAIWEAPIPEAYFQKALHRLRPKGDFHPKLLVSLLHHFASSGGLSDYVTQTSIAHLTKEKFATVPLPKPPRDEQIAIADALGAIGNFIASLDALIAKKRDIKQAAMQQLLTGKTRLPGYSANWVAMRLGRMVEFSKGRGLPKSALKPSGSAPCIHYGELFTHYGPIISSITSRTFETPSATRSRSNDVLMPTSDVTPRGLAKASCVLVDGVIIGGDALIIRPDPTKLNGVFLAYLIRQSEAAVLNLVRGSTVFHIYAPDLSRLKLNLPKVDEQVAIAEVLTDMDAELEQLGIKRAKAASLKDGMMQQLLTGRIRLV